MKKRNKVPSLVTISVFTVITTVLWIGFEIYRVLTVKQPPSVSEEILSPLSPNLDIKSLDKVQERVHLEESEIVSTPLNTPKPTVTPTPELSPTPQASGTPSPTAQ